MICKKLDDGCDNGVGRCVDESQDAGTKFSLQGDFLLSIVENGYHFDPTKTKLSLTFV